MVEGDAENLFLPVLAETLGYSLEKYGNLKRTALH